MEGGCTAGAEQDAGLGGYKNEALEIVRGLSTGDWFEFHGECYDIEPIRLSPAPTAPLPLLIGGHSDAALQRAARLADGWMHGGGGAASDLDGALARLAELRREYGRAKEPFELHVISFDAFTVDGVRQLENQGITDVIVGFRDMYSADSQPLQDKIDAFRMFADTVIAKV